MVSDDTLQRCFERAGRPFGYDEVEAVFFPHVDLKVTWHRSGCWAEFKVSDYLADAPEGVIQDLADNIFSKICSDGLADYPKGLLRWVTDPSFCASKRDAFLRRDGDVRPDPKGDFKDLEECMGRLEAAGLVPEDLDVAVVWLDAEPERLTKVSVLMRAVKVSTLLDGDDVPDSVLDYCVYRRLCAVMAGFDPESEDQDERIAEMQSRFPGRKEAERWLRKRDLRP